MSDYDKGSPADLERQVKDVMGEFEELLYGHFRNLDITRTVFMTRLAVLQEEFGMFTSELKSTFPTGAWSKNEASRPQS